jgi:hypothetical protein
MPAWRTSGLARTGVVLHVCSVLRELTLSVTDVARVPSRRQGAIPVVRVPSRQGAIPKVILQ